MRKDAQYHLIFFLFFLTCSGTLPAYGQSAAAYNIINPSETSPNLPLLNGRIWHNKYSRAQGDPYFLSDGFLKGSVSFNGRKYDDLDLRYDIFNDELILRTENKPIIIMNKEMVDDFDLIFENRIHHIINTGNDTSSILKGYVNLLYDGPSALFVKYSKIIYPLGAEGRYDLFSQEHRVFMRTETGLVPVKRKRGLLNLFGSERKEIRDHLRRSRIRITWKEPSTLVPVLEYYDTIRK